MALTPLNPRNKRTYVQQQELWKAQKERPYARDIARILNASAREAAEAVKQGLDPMTGPYLTDGMDADLREVFAARTAKVSKDQAAIIVRSAKMSFNHERKSFEDDLDMHILAYIQSFTANKVTRVSDTTKKLIRAAIRRGLQEGLASAQIATMIRRRLRSINRARALMIARTEVNSVANSATQFSVNSFGFTYRQQWLSASDARRRPTHGRANFQTREQNEPFEVGGFLLGYPGDPQGPPQEIINCRCTTAILTE